MKVKIALLIGMFCSCRQNHRKTITEVFQPEYKIEKAIITTVYKGRKYLGSEQSILFPTDTTAKAYTTTLFLNNDSTFTYCDYTSGTYFGKWQSSRDSAVLVPYSTGNNIISFRVSLSKSTTSPKAVFIVTDKTNKPIENFTIQPFNDKPLYVYDLHGHLDRTKGNQADTTSFWNFGTDSNGIKVIDKRKIDSLDFTKLYPLTHSRFSISTRDLPDTIKLTININGCVFFQNEVHIINMTGVPHAKVILHQDKFVFPFD